MAYRFRKNVLEDNLDFPEFRPGNKKFAIARRKRLNLELNYEINISQIDSEKAISDATERYHKSTVPFIPEVGRIKRLVRGIRKYFGYFMPPMY